MTITEFSSRKIANGKTVNVEWRDFVERLKTPVVTDETLDEYQSMTNEQRTDIKDVGGYVAGQFIDGKRSKNSLKDRCVVTIDADEATQDDVDNYTCLYDTAVFIHTTHTSTSENLRLRWLFPLSRPVTSEEYKILAGVVAEWVGVNTVDETTDQPERLMFWPSVSLDADYNYWDIAGDFLDPDTILDALNFSTEESKPKGKITSGEYNVGELDSVSEGTRNKVVFNYLARQRDFGMDEEALHEIGTYFNNRFCVPPLPEFELKTIINSVLKYTPGELIPFASRDAQIDFSDIGKFDKKKKEVWLENGNELMARNIKPLEFIIPGILPIGLGVLYSPPKYGKSFFVLDMAISVATGTSFLGLETNKCGTLYISLEDYDGALKERMKPIILNREDVGSFYHVHDALSLADGLTEQLDAYLQKYPDIRLIIIDTFVKIRGTAKKNESAYDHDYKELSVLKDWVKSREVAIFLVHHTRKTIDSDDFVMNANGTSGITGAADFIYGMTRRARKDPTTVLNITGRYVKSKSYIIQFNEMTNRWENLGEEKDVRETTEDAEYRKDSVVKAIVHYLDEAEDLLDDEQSEEDSATYTATSQDIINAIESLYSDNSYHESSRAMGKHISALAPKLLERDGIDYKYVRSNNERRHVFTRERL